MKDPVAPPSLATSATAFVGAQSPTSGPITKRCPTCGARHPATFRVCPQDASLLEEVADGELDPLIGRVLMGSYEVLRAVGSGGMGRVYEAKHLRLEGKRFAIKVLLDEYARVPDLLQRFEREAQAAATLSHPNVVAVYDVNRTEDGIPFIVSEFLEGREFGDLLDEVGTLPAPRTVRIVRQVCSALAAAHARGIVHRDVKPENVFLVGDLEAPLVKVIDFGISKVQETGSAGLTRTGMVMGTPSYMAPEQARGARVDHRADVYGVGGILYRALTGRRPFEDEDAAGVLARVLTEEPPRPRSVNPSVPEALEVVIQRALSKDVEERYQSLQELEAELALLDPMGTAPVTPSVTLVAASAGGVQPPTREPTVLLERTLTEIRRARPALVALTALAFLWLSALVVVSIADLIRWMRHGAGITLAESLLLGIGTLLITATPTVVWIRHLRAGVWQNSVRAVETSRKLRTLNLVVLATFGLGVLALELWYAVIQRVQQTHETLIWLGPLALVSLGAGAVAWSRQQTRRSLAD